MILSEEWSEILDRQDVLFGMKDDPRLIKICAAIDAGFQRRGSGLSYNSPSGKAEIHFHF